MVISANEVEERFEEAALTLRRLPGGVGPRGYASSWPEVLREQRHAYGYHETRLRVVPTAREIQRMDEVFDWLRLIDDPVDRRIVWMRADGHRWRAVCRQAGLSRSAAWRRWGAALVTVSRRLSAPARGGKGRRGKAGAQTRSVARTAPLLDRDG